VPNAFSLEISFLTRPGAAFSTRCVVARRVTRAIDAAANETPTAAFELPA
jgi:hypothetical protein